MINISQFSSEWMRRVSEGLFYLFLLLLPIIVLPATVFVLATHKSYIAYTLLIPAAIFFLAYTLREGRFSFPKTWIYLPLLLFTIIAGVASVFSPSKMASLFGAGFEAHTLSSMVIFATAFMLSSVILDSEKKWRVSMWVLYASFILLFLTQVVTIVQGTPFFPWLGSAITANLFGSWNELGIFAAFVMLVALLNFDLTGWGKFKIVSGVVALAALLLLLFVNFTIVWWVVGALLIVFLSYLYSRFRHPKMFIRVPFFVLLVALLGVLANASIANMVRSMGVEFVEVRPSWQATGEVLEGVLKESPVLGTGPNTFLYDWLRFRPDSITETAFWQTRFSSGVGTLPTWVAHTGILGAGALAVFFLFYLWLGLRTLMQKEDVSPLAVSTFFGSLFLWVFAIIYPLSFVGTALLFVMTGAFVSLAAVSGTIKIVELSLFERSGVGFLAALSMIFLIILSVSWMYLLSQKYVSAYYYGEAVEAIGRGNYDRARGLVDQALQFDTQDTYYRTFTELDLVQLSELIANTQRPTEQLRLEVQNALSELIGHAQSAKDKNPADPINWMNLGRVYEAILPLGIEGAAEFAKAAYSEAGKRFPKSPEPHFASARVELAEGKTETAKGLLVKAIEAKGDYPEAHFVLAQIEAGSGNLNAAIQSAETAALLLPNDIGTLFQLGLLYYQKQNFANAQVVLERAVAINENYSNARYFLGLMYARAGDREKALGEFQKILELNPGNEEVVKIISNLESGRESLAGISPPAPLPEKRSAPPVSEGR